MYILEFLVPNVAGKLKFFLHQLENGPVRSVINPGNKYWVQLEMVPNNNTNPNKKTWPSHRKMIFANWLKIDQLRLQVHKHISNNQNPNDC